MLKLDNIVADWKRLARNEGFAFINSDGELILTAQLRSGLLRSSGHVSIGASLSEREGLIAAVLAVYLLIRRNDETVAGAAATSGTASP